MGQWAQPLVANFLGVIAMSETASRQISPALERGYQFLAWLVPTLDKFPRRQKFLLGDRIENTALDVLEGLVEATYTRNRGRILEAVNLKLDKLRFLFRLSAELQLLDQRRYEHASRGIDEIGRLVGGWIRAHRGQAPS
jgi:23S rRNA-intervening sequence protein